MFSSDAIPKFFQLAPLSLGGCIFLVSIFAIMFSISDFSNDTIKNIASKGFHREYIYLSKLITILFFAVLSLALAFVTALITAQIVVNKAIPNFFEHNNDFAKSLGFLGLQIVTYTSIAVFLSTTFRSLGPALSIFLVFVFFCFCFLRWAVFYVIYDMFSSTDNEVVLVVCVFCFNFVIKNSFLN